MVAEGAGIKPNLAGRDGIVEILAPVGIGGR